MDVLFALIILGALFYAGKVILEYAVHTSAVQSQIDRAAAETIRLADEAEDEAVYSVTVRERVEVLRGGLQGLQLEAQKLRIGVDREQERRSRLQVAVYRERLRRSRRAVAS